MPSTACGLWDTHQAYQMHAICTFAVCMTMEYLESKAAMFGQMLWHHIIVFRQQLLLDTEA